MLPSLKDICEACRAMLCMQGQRCNVAQAEGAAQVVATECAFSLTTHAKEITSYPFIFVTMLFHRQHARKDYFNSNVCGIMKAVA
jgi:hypothetical protein